MLFEELMNEKPSQERPERSVPALKRVDRDYKVKGSHGSSVSASTFKVTMIAVGAIAAVAIVGAVGWVVYTAFQIYLGN